MDEKTKQSLQHILKAVTPPDAGTQGPSILTPDSAGLPLDGLLEPLAATVSGLQEGMTHVFGQMHSVGQITDVLRLTLKMFINILIEKSVITEEEYKERYQKEVVDVINAFHKKMEEKMNQAKQEPSPLQKDMHQTQEETPQEEYTGDVVLPSERNNVIKFKR